MNEKDRALTKLRAEIARDIAHARGQASACGVLELLYLLYQLRAMRMFAASEHYEHEVSNGMRVVLQLHQDTIKYCIALVAKYSHWEYRSNPRKTWMIDVEHVEALQRTVNHLNSKFEYEGAIALHDITVQGERDRHCAFDIRATIEDPERKPFFEYFFRVEHWGHIAKEKLLSADNLYDEIRRRYAPIDAEFKHATGMTVEELINGIQALIAMYVEQVGEKLLEADMLRSGYVDARSQKNILSIMGSFVFPKAVIQEKLGEAVWQFIEKCMLIPDYIDEGQLRYLQVTRRPVLAHGAVVVISPDLLFDSLLDNLHYMLLENKDTEAAYKASQADSFLDRIAEVGGKYGFHEQRREWDLYEGKVKIGDVDLVLEDDCGNVLFIEAKNHVLPLDIQFKHLEPAKAHLAAQRDQWERKVLHRLQHLRDNASEYGISKNFRYLVVSRMPEVISHFSELLVLCIDEFEHWLVDGRQEADFASFYAKHYGGESGFIDGDVRKALAADGFITLQVEPLGQ